jgi:hypothetical protein
VDKPESLEVIMETLRTRLGVIQNLSLLDRSLRWVLTVALLAVPAVHVVFYGEVLGWWHGLSLLLSVYPGLTAFWGWDPFYEAAGYKTCDLSDRNQCGTLPFQIDAALGHHPIPDKDFDHSLAGSHHSNR